jgi:hypothetical protein
MSDRLPSTKFPVGISIHSGGMTFGDEDMTLALFPLVAKPFAEICGSCIARAARAPAFAPSASVRAALSTGLLSLAILMASFSDI